MNVLVACEESQAVCIAFRSRGHRAFSCDIQECSGGHPEWHIQGDVLPLINGNCSFVTADSHTHTQVGPWDLLIAHPPCTYLTVSGNRWFDVSRYGEAAEQRKKERKEGIEFFLKFAQADCKRIAIENPIGVMSTVYRKPDQIINPYEFGHKARKPTCLWLKGLARLEPTNIVEPDLVSWISNKGTVKTMSADYGRGSPGHSKRRSKTYEGIAEAMGDQWGTDKPKLGQLNLFDDMEEIYDS